MGSGKGRSFAFSFEAARLNRAASSANGYALNSTIARLDAFSNGDVNELESRFATWFVLARLLSIVTSFLLTARAAKHLAFIQSYRAYVGADVLDLVS